MVYNGIGGFMVKIGIPLKYSHLSDGRCILYLGERVRRTIQAAGGFVIPIVQVQDVDYSDTHYPDFDPLSEEEMRNIDSYLDMVDGVLLPGGFKITPFDQYLLEKCIERDIPTLGICLGMQLMSCVGEDFLVYKNDSEINHFQESDNLLTHKVNIKKDSLLYNILKKDEILVNSFHKYHVSVNNNYSINAISKMVILRGLN